MFVRTLWETAGSFCSHTESIVQIQFVLAATVSNRVTIASEVSTRCRRFSLLHRGFRYTQETMDDGDRHFRQCSVFGERDWRR